MGGPLSRGQEDLMAWGLFARVPHPRPAHTIRPRCKEIWTGSELGKLELRAAMGRASLTPAPRAKRYGHTSQDGHGDLEQAGPVHPNTAQECPAHGTHMAGEGYLVVDVSRLQSVIIIVTCAPNVSQERHGPGSDPHPHPLHTFFSGGTVCSHRGPGPRFPAFCMLAPRAASFSCPSHRCAADKSRDRCSPPPPHLPSSGL